MSETDLRLLDLLDEPLPRALRQAAGGRPCHLVGGVLRDRLLGLGGSDYDAVVAGAGRAIGERLARRLPARLVHLGGKTFAAYRLVGDGFTLDIWDRREHSLEADMARRDFTVNAFALDLASRRLFDPFDGLADLARRRLRATTPGVFTDDPLRLLRLVRLSLCLPGFAADPASLDLAREAAAGLGAVAVERVRDELGKILRAAAFLPGFELLVELELYPGLLAGRPGEAGDPRTARRRLRRLEPALAHLDDLPRLPGGALERAGARLATLFSGLASAAGGSRTSLERYRAAGYLTAREAARCRRLMACREAPRSEAGRRRFLHRWGDDWPAAAAMLAARGEAGGDGWRTLVARLVELAERHGRAIFDPLPLLDGREIGRLLELPPGPELGAAVALLRRAQVEGRVAERSAAEAFLRSSSSGAG